MLDRYINHVPRTEARRYRPTQQLDHHEHHQPDSTYYLPRVGQRSIAMSMSVRLCPRLSVYYAGSVNNIAVSH